MILFSRRLKVFFLMSLLAGVSLAIGFFLGVGLANAVQKKKDDPVFIGEAMVKQLDKLKPDGRQRERFKAIVDDAVAELLHLRDDTKKEALDIVTKRVLEIDRELTAGQKEVFAKMQPKSGDVIFELLRKARDQQPAAAAPSPPLAR